LTTHPEPTREGLIALIRAPITVIIEPITARVLPHRLSRVTARAPHITHRHPRAHALTAGERLKILVDVTITVIINTITEVNGDARVDARI
jgi:hypothetical protein